MYFHCRDSVHVSAELQAGGGGGDDGVQVRGGGGEDVRAGHQVVPGLQPLPLAGPPAPPLEGGPAAGGHQTHRPRVSGQSSLSTDNSQTYKSDTFSTNKINLDGKDEIFVGYMLEL